MDEKGPGWLIILIILVVLYLLFRGAGGICKYEGLTAQEWFNEYDYQVGLNEELRYQNMELEEKYEEFEDEYENLEYKYRRFKDCIEEYSESLLYYCE